MVVRDAHLCTDCDYSDGDGGARSPVMVPCREGSPRPSVKAHLAANSTGLIPEVAIAEAENG
jgi:hypothetical protein